MTNKTIPFQLVRKIQQKIIMQQTGTLKKRKKRNLAKVGGLSTKSYNEAEDDFDGSLLFTVPTQNFSDINIPSYQVENESDFNYRKSPYINQYDSQHYPNAGRVTRNPSFLAEDPEGDKAVLDRIATANSYPSEDDTYLKPRSEYIKERPHLLDKATVSRLRQILILGTCSGAFPWYWSKKNYRIEKFGLTMEKLWKVQWLFVTVQIGLITIFQFYSFFSRLSLKGEKTGFRGVFMNFFSVYWYICAVYFNINMFFYKDQIRNYINSLLRFNKEYVDKYLVHTEGYQEGGRVLINLSIPCNISQVFASVALFLVMPYQPWFLFSYIYPKPWYWLIPGAIQEFIMAGQVITSFILVTWIVVAHSNSMEFWLRETHNHNESDYTKDELRHTKTALETYRSLQLLCSCFNDCMSPLAIPLVKIHIITGITPCGYVLIRSMNHIFIEEFPAILTYPIGIVDCLTATFAMLTMAAEMFDLSVSFIDSWSRTRQKSLRRVLMSCPTLKVKVARFYFITVTTTITFVKVIFDLITDCIITFP